MSKRAHVARTPQLRGLLHSRETNIDYSTSTGRCSALECRAIKRSLSCKLVATNSGVILRLTRNTRDEAYLSQELKWMHMEEIQLASAARCSGGVGADETTLIERVEPSSRVTACLSIPTVHKLLHVLEKSWATTQSSNVSCGGVRTCGQRHNFPEKNKLKHLSSKP